MTWTEHRMTLEYLDDQVAIFRTDGPGGGSKLEIPRAAWDLRKTAVKYVVISDEPNYEALHRDSEAQAKASLERVAAELDKNHTPK